MDADGLTADAFAESVVFLSFFSDLPDPRQRGRVQYPLDEILLLCLVAVLAGSDCIADIARFSQTKRDLLRRFRPFAEGTPSHDHLGDILASLDAAAFQRCFVSWTASLTGVDPDVIAIVLRQAQDEGQDLAPVLQDERWKRPHPHGPGLRGPPAPRHATSQGREMSNAISAIPKLLAMMAIEGAVVTIDAMGCQREIARAIVDKKADDILALKGNQGILCDDVALFVAEQKANGFKDTIVSRDTTVESDHGRIETRTTTVIHIVDRLDGHRWPGLKSIVVIDAQREIDGNIQTETRLYITSLVLLAHAVGPLVRSHWAVENSIHRVMDMTFRDDECRLRTDHALANFTTVKHMACNLMRRTSGKDSLRMNRKIAAWDDDYLAAIITP